MNLFTIGFTQQSAETFFSSIRNAGIVRVVDVRLRNRSQLAGFAKGGDLPFFLREICGVDYHHEPLLAPTEALLDDYKQKRIGWDEYALRFSALLQQRKVEKAVSLELLRDACLLCSERLPHQCHRRVLAEYLAQHWRALRITHL